jgi:hypothetical protein
LQVRWQPTAELFNDIPSISTYFLYREFSSSFAVATLGKNAITDDCILKTHLHAKANYQAMCDSKRKKVCT